MLSGDHISHKALRGYWETGNTRGLNADWLARLGRILDALDAATEPGDMNLPGFRFHELGGDRAGTYTVRLTGNMRVTFLWDDGPRDVDIEDYH